MQRSYSLRHYDLKSNVFKLKKLWNRRASNTNRSEDMKPKQAYGERRCENRNGKRKQRRKKNLAVKSSSWWKIFMFILTLHIKRTLAAYSLLTQQSHFLSYVTRVNIRWQYPNIVHFYTKTNTNHERASVARARKARADKTMCLSEMNARKEKRRRERWA